MSTAGALTTEQATSQPKVNPWIIGVAVSLAAFMEALDTSIANVALPHIAGSMGASNDESTWVLTSYLVSNAVVLLQCPAEGDTEGFAPALVCVGEFGWERVAQHRAVEDALRNPVQLDSLDSLPIPTAGR